MGRQPTSTIDAIIGNKEWSEMLNHSQHIEILLEIETELGWLAHDNDKKRIQTPGFQEGGVGNGDKRVSKVFSILEVRGAFPCSGRSEFQRQNSEKEQTQMDTC